MKPRAAAVLVALIVIAVLGTPPASALDVACPLPTVEPVAAPEGLDMGIFVTDVAPTGSAATNLLGHLDRLSHGDRDDLTIHLFSHYRGAASLPGEVEHESDVIWFADQGFSVELTVPYRVPIGASPDPAGYVAYLETVVERVGSRLEGLMVTNEVNINFWEGPSDGIHPGAFDALVMGVPAAHSAIDALGLDVEVGFKWGYRHPSLDAERAFWTAIDEQGGAAFRDALDFVGIDLYAFDFYVGDNSIADYTRQALQEMRACFLPLAGIGSSTPIRVTEAGAPTLMWGEDGQAQAIADMIDTASAYSGSLHVDAWRQWGLYCGPTPPGPGAVFHCTGLLREDGSDLPSFAVFAERVAGRGTIPEDPPPVDPPVDPPTTDPTTHAATDDAPDDPAATASPGDQSTATVAIAPRYTG